MHPEPFGTTQDGKCWAAKALHPSDVDVTIDGVPDEYTCPTFMQNYNTMARINANTTAVGTWTGNILILPHPIFFASYSTIDNTGPYSSVIINSQLGSSVPNTAALNWLGSISAWRLAYAGVTILQDGASLNDQGTIAACQFTLPSQTFNASILTTGVTNALTHIRDYSSATIPAFNSIVNMPLTYVGKSKEGVYMPLKLTPEALRWKNMNDLNVLGPDMTNFVTNGPVIGQALPTTANTNTFPFYGLNAASVNSVTGVVTGTPTPCLDGDNVGIVSFQNMAVSSTLSLYFRYGYEYKVNPGSQFSGLQTISPQWDPVALNAYFNVSRQLKDGYPSDFNSLGKLWGVIRPLLKTGASLPMGPLSMLSSGALTLGDILAETGSSKKQKEKDKRGQPPRPPPPPPPPPQSQSIKSAVTQAVKQAVVQELKSATGLHIQRKRKQN
jgi:hypothetical protein